MQTVRLLGHFWVIYSVFLNIFGITSCIRCMKYEVGVALTICLKPTDSWNKLPICCSILRSIFLWPSVNCTCGWAVRPSTSSIAQTPDVLSTTSGRTFLFLTETITMIWYMCQSLRVDYSSYRECIIWCILPELNTRIDRFLTLF